jgi:hypothetical protein
MCCIELTADLVTIIAFPTALIGLYFTYQTFKQSLVEQKQTKNIEEAKLWLQLRTDFYRYNHIHEYLLNNNNWDANIDLTGLYGYLGQFELCNSMINSGIINLLTFKSQYKYRLQMLLANESIRKILITDTRNNWNDLAELFEKVELKYPIN